MAAAHHTVRSATGITALLQGDIDARVHPGAVWAVGDTGGRQASGALGVLDPTDPSRPMSTDTVFDVASLTRALYGTDPAAIRCDVLHEQLRRPPGQAVEYTDRAALILGFLIECLAGRGLTDTAHEHSWAPLGMTETRFGPLPPHLAARCAPTETEAR
jgi:CubicO group peptidase (beta-lactamase class C family)